MKDLSAHILDIVQNSIRAKAGNIEVHLEENPVSHTYTIIIRDDGCGMSPETLQQVSDPFFTSRNVRKVGLGIPLLKQNAEQTGGFIRIDSEAGKGTSVKAVFISSHLDCPPEGDIAGSLALLIGANPEIHFLCSYSRGDKNYRLDTDEVKEVLEDVPLNDPQIIRALKTMLDENIQELKHP